MSTQPLSLQDSIAAWLQATRAQESVTPDFSVTTTPAEGLVDMAKPSQPKVDWTAMALESAKTMALRVGGGVAGGVVGSLAGPVGTFAGIATGAAMGDQFAQQREVASGQRDAVNPLEMLAAGATAPIPGGTIARGTRLLPALGRAALTAQPANLASSVALQMAEGQPLSLGRTAQDMGASTLLGGGIGLGIRGAQALPGVATRVAQSTAVQRLMTDETGAIGPRDSLKWNTPVKPASLKNLESHYRMAPAPIRQALLTGLDPKFVSSGDSGVPVLNFDALLFAAKAGDPEAVEALGILRLKPTGNGWASPAGAQGRPSLLQTPTPAEIPLTPPPLGADVPSAPGTYVEQRASGSRTVTVGRNAPAAPPAAAVPAAPVVGAPAVSAAKKSRQPYAPERPLDPTNLPETIEPRRDLQPAQVQEDIERSFRYHTEIIGMEPTQARELAEATATPEAWQRRQRIMPLSEQQAKANVIDALDLPTAKGTTLNAPQQLALADTFRAVSDQVANLNTKIGGSMAALEQGVLSGAPDAIAKMQSVAADLGVQGLDGIKRARLEAYDLLHRLNLQSEAVRSEWGRAGRAMQVEAKSRKLDDAAFLKRAYEMGAPTDEALDALDALRGNPEGQRQYLIDIYKPSGQEYWKAYLANNMLSGVPTLGVNVVSNSNNLVRKELARYQVAGIERAAGVASREVAIPPARLMAQSYADGMRHAGKAFMSAMWDGRTELDDNIAINVTETFRGHWLAKALEKSGMEQELSAKLGKLAANKWKRILVGTDAAFQMMAIYPEAYRRATADGINQGLSGPDLADHILARVKDFDYHADASGAVRDYAKKTTFADEFGPVASAFQKFVNSVDGGTVRIADKMHAVRTGQVVGKDFASGSKMKLVQYPLGFAHFPFVRIGATLWKQAVGLLTDVPRAGYNLATGQGDRAQNLQRLVESANAYMLMGTFAALYEAGAIDFTTRAPENTFEREQFYGPEGKLPWAVGLGGRYIPMASFGPLGSAMAPVAAYLKGVSKDDDQTRAQRFAEATAAVAKMHLDGTLVRTAMSTFEGLTDDSKTGRLFGNYIAQNIPEGAFLRNVRDVTDTTLRDPETFVEEAKAQLPGLASTVRPRLNVWGQDIQKQSVGKRVYGSAPQGDGDYVGAELIKLKDALPDLGRLDEGVYPPDLKVAVSAFEKSLESAMNKGVTRTEDGIKVRFTDADRQRYMRLVGESIHDVLSSAIAPDAGWEDLDSTQKRDLVKKLKKMGKEMGEDLFMAEWEMPQ